jgi:transcription termination factor Rho
MDQEEQNSAIMEQKRGNKRGPRKKLIINKEGSESDDGLSEIGVRKEKEELNLNAEEKDVQGVDVEKEASEQSFVSLKITRENFGEKIDEINNLLLKQNQFLLEKKKKQREQLNKDQELIDEFEKFLKESNFEDEDGGNMGDYARESDNKNQDSIELSVNDDDYDTITDVKGQHLETIMQAVSKANLANIDILKKDNNNMIRENKDGERVKRPTICMKKEERYNEGEAEKEIRSPVEEKEAIKEEEEEKVEEGDTVEKSAKKIFTPIESIELNFLKSKTTPELIEYGKDKVEDISSMYRQEMISAILKQFSESNPENTIIGEGVLEVLPDGFGFLRYSDCDYVASPYDIYVSFAQIKKFALRTGDSIKGTIKAPKKNEKYFSLLRLDAINNQTVEESKHRIRFDDLIPLYPQEKLMLENEELFRIKKDDTCRILDMISPIGKGQRALIVAPPKTGKTTILQNIAHAITKAHPEIELIVLLIDERPEEVTDMDRSIKGEVVSSTFDEPALRHVQLAEIVIEKAKRIVETGKDVVILLDSITRLARAYNNVVPSSGKVLTGGVDANALQKPKRFFGAARNIENGGSLTIIATALIETGSKMDEVIFEEFKGTGNSEILLDRKISDKRIFPAVDMVRSSTRREELLLEKSVLVKVWMLRKILSAMDSVGAMEFLKEKLDVTKNNVEFFKSMNG